MIYYIRNIRFLVALLCFTLFNKASGEISITNYKPFWYVHMDFQKNRDYLHIAIDTFLLECEKQKIKPDNEIYLIHIIYSGELPSWGIGLKTGEKCQVNPPLESSRYIYRKVARKVHTGDSDSIYKSNQQLDYFIKEKEYDFAGPRIFVWSYTQAKANPEMQHIEIIQPVQKNTLVEISLFLSAFVCLFIAFFLFSNRKYWSLASLIFAIMLISYALGRIGWLLYYQKDLVNIYIHTKHIGDAFFILTYPLLLLYIQSFTDKGFKLRLIHYFHLLPCLLFLA